MRSGIHLLFALTLPLFGKAAPANLVTQEANSAPTAIKEEPSNSPKSETPSHDQKPTETKPEAVWEEVKNEIEITENEIKQDIKTGEQEIARITDTERKKMSEELRSHFGRKKAPRRMHPLDKPIIKKKNNHTPVDESHQS